MDPILASEGRVPESAVIDLRPGHVIIFSELGQFRARVSPVETDAQHLESLGMEAVVGGSNVGGFGAAGAAPRRPEIEQNHFAFVCVGELDKLAVGGFSFKRGGLFACSQPSLGILSRGALRRQEQGG